MSAIRRRRRRRMVEAARSTAPRVGAPDRRRVALRIVVALLAVLPYLDSLTAAFTLDDVRVIAKNPMVQGAEPAVRLLTWVDRPEIYRPLTMLTYAANRRVGGSSPPYHAVNVLLHAAVSVLAIEVAWLTLGSATGAGVAGALFAVHPVHTEAVTNVVGRAELLAAFWVLVCLLALVRSEQADVSRSRRSLWLALSVGAFAAGLGSKESAVTAIALCACVPWWVSRAPSPRRTLAILLPYLAIAAVFLVWRRYLVGAIGMPVPPNFVVNPLAHVGPLVRIATAIAILGQYLLLLTAPVTLSSDYSFDQVPLVTSLLDPRLLATGALLAGLIVILRRAPTLAVSAAFFFVPLAATANIVVPIGTIKAERLLYLPSLGWCLAVGLIATALAHRWPRAVLAAAVIVISVFAARTWVRNEDWRDDRTVYAVAVRTAPRSAKAHYDLALDLLKQRRVAEAIAHLRTSVAIDPGFVVARSNLGSALALTGDLAGAAAQLGEAVRLSPGSVAIHANLAQVLLRQSRVDEALDQLEAARRLEPASRDVLRLLGTLYLQRGRLDQAVERLTAAVSLDASDADAQNNLGVALLRLGRTEQAIPHLEAAVRARPDHLQAGDNLRAARSKVAGPR